MPEALSARVRGAPGGLSALVAAAPGSVLLIEAGFDQAGEGFQAFVRVEAVGAQFDRGAHAGAQHHQAHDGAGGNHLVVAHDVDVAENRSAVVTNLAAARACRPRRLRS